MKNNSLKDSIIQLNRELLDCQDLSQNSIDLIEFILDEIDKNDSFKKDLELEWQLGA